MLNWTALTTTAQLNGAAGIASWTIKSGTSTTNMSFLVSHSNSPASITYTVDTTLVDDGTIYYSVTPVVTLTADGVESTAVAANSVAATAAGVPTNLRNKLFSLTQIEMEWDTLTSALFYYAAKGSTLTGAFTDISVCKRTAGLTCLDAAPGTASSGGYKYYKVRGLFASDLSGVYSTPVKLWAAGAPTVAPAAPTLKPVVSTTTDGVTTTNIPTADLVVIVWTAVTTGWNGATDGVTDYTVTYGLDNVAATAVNPVYDHVQTANTAGTMVYVLEYSHNTSTILDGLMYYRLTATTVAGTTALSSASAGILSANAPGAPTAVIESATFKATADMVKITWTKPVQTTTNGRLNGGVLSGYNVYYGFSPTTVTTLCAATPTVSTDTAAYDHTVTGATFPDGLIFYAVEAINNLEGAVKGTSPKSAVSLGILSGAPFPPYVPTALIQSATNGSDCDATNVTWTAPDNNGGAPILNYSITYSLTAGGSVAGTFTSTTLSYTHDTTSVTNGRLYYKVAANNKVGLGPYTAETEIDSSCKPLPAFDLKMKVGSTQSTDELTVQWTAGDNQGQVITGCTVYYYFANTDNTNSVTGATASTSIAAGTNEYKLDATSVTDGEITFYVKCTNSIGTSDAQKLTTDTATSVTAGQKMITLCSCSVPGVPTGFTAVYNQET